MASNSEEMGRKEVMTMRKNQSREEVITMAWKSKKPLLYKFQAEGDKLEGVLLSCTEAEYGKQYDIASKDGYRYFFYGSADLDRQLENCLGSTCKVEFLGFVKTKNGRDMRSFSVQVWEDDGETDVPL